jgi:hypothetical protein
VPLTPVGVGPSVAYPLTTAPSTPVGPQSTATPSAPVGPKLTTIDAWITSPLMPVHLWPFVAPLLTTLPLWHPSARGPLHASVDKHVLSALWPAAHLVIDAPSVPAGLWPSAVLLSTAAVLSARWPVDDFTATLLARGRNTSTSCWPRNFFSVPRHTCVGLMVTLS